MRNLSEFLSSWRVPRGKPIESTRRSNAEKFRTGGEWKSSAKSAFSFEWAALHNEVPDDLRRRLWLLMQKGAADLARSGALERHPASRQLVQHGFERKQVCLSAEFLGANFLRRHVGGGAHHGSRGGQVARLAPGGHGLGRTAHQRAFGRTMPSLWAASSASAISIILSPYLQACLPQRTDR